MTPEGSPTVPFAAPEGAQIPSHCGPFLGPVNFPSLAPRFVLVALPKTARSPAGRAKVREALVGILSAWAACPVRLEETHRGPHVPTLIRGQRVFVSVTYSADTAWMALGLEAAIGVDAVNLAECDDWQDVAAVYFGEPRTSAISATPDPKQTFALEWATLEARCKQAGMPLRENAAPLPTTTYRNVLDQTVLAVAFEPDKTAVLRR